MSCPCCGILQDFLLFKGDNTPLYVYPTLALFMSIHSHLCGFHLLAIVNKAAMNTGMVGIRIFKAPQVILMCKRG